MPNLVGLMWVPQHLIPAALYTLLLLQLRRQPRFLAVSGVVLAAGLFWSPFVALGLLPLAAIPLVENGPQPFLRWPNLLLALPLAGLLVAYLTSGPLLAPRSWIWEGHEWPQLALVVVVTWLAEFLLLAFLLGLLRPRLRREPFFIVSVAMPMVWPWYLYGFHGDLARRAALPALFVLCWYCAHAVIDSWPEIAQSFRTKANIRSGWVGLASSWRAWWL